MGTWLSSWLLFAVSESSDCPVVHELPAPRGPPHPRPASLGRPLQPSQQDW